MLPLPRLRDPVWFPVESSSSGLQSLCDVEEELKKAKLALEHEEPTQPNIGFKKNAPETLKVASDSMSRDPTDPYLSDQDVDEFELI